MKIDTYIKNIDTQIIEDENKKKFRITTELF